MVKNPKSQPPFTMLPAPFYHLVNNRGKGKAIGGEFIFDGNWAAVLHYADDEFAGFKVFQLFGEYAGGNLRNVSLYVPEPAFAAKHRH
jgi:hypothetical protein